MVHHYCDATGDDVKRFKFINDQTSDQSLGLYLELVYNLCGGVMTGMIWEVVDHTTNKMQETGLFISHYHKTDHRTKPMTYGLAEECSTTELTLFPNESPFTLPLEYHVIPQPIVFIPCHSSADSVHTSSDSDRVIRPTHDMPRFSQYG